MRFNELSTSDLDAYTIVFNHVPKCGGSSLIAMFNEVFGPERCYRARNRDDAVAKERLSLSDQTDDQLSEYRFIAGHFPYGHHERLESIGKQVLYVTVLREPLSWIISAYYHNLERGKPRLMERAKSMTLNEWILDTLKRPNTTVIKGGTLRQVTGRSDLDEAKEVINREYLIACEMSQLDDMQTMLAHKFRRPDLAPQKKNLARGASKKNKDVSDEVRDRFDEAAALDKALLAHVAETFAAQREAFTATA